jgi:hypothetical protein
MWTCPPESSQFTDAVEIGVLGIVAIGFSSIRGSADANRLGADPEKVGHAAAIGNNLITELKLLPRADAGSV